MDILYMSIEPFVRIFATTCAILFFPAIITLCVFVYRWKWKSY